MQLLKLYNAYPLLTALRGVIGITNIFLSAPAYMQIIHLLGSDVLWIVFS